MSQFASKDDLLAAQAARIAELESQLEAIGAGGVEPLRKQAVAQQALQAAVPQIKANCYSNDDGDYWRDCPDDCDFVEGLKVGDTYELQASIRSWSETFRVTKAPDETSDDYEVELVSSDAPAHPAEGVPEQTAPGMTAERASYFMRRFLKEEKLLGPNEQAAMHYVISLLAATQPAAQGMEQDAARYRWLRRNVGVYRTNDGAGPVSTYLLTQTPAKDRIAEETDAAVDAALAAQAKQGGA
jgi:hypothetical protein